MINSPLEQFNILSVYDASLLNASIFQIVCIKILLCTWHIIINLPETVFFKYNFIGGALVGTYKIAQSALFMLPVAVGTTTRAIHSATNEFSLLLGLGDTILNFFYDFYHKLLSFIWCNICYDAHANILHSPSNLYITQPILDMAENIEQREYKSGMFDINFSLISGSSPIGLFFTNLYFMFVHISLWLWSCTHDSIIQGLLSFLSYSPNDFSYLVLSLNTSTIWLTLGFIVTTFLLSSILSSTTLLPKNNWQAVIEMFYQMVLDVVNENAGPVGRKYFPLIFTTFLIILFCNLMGMIPYSFTVTSHIIVTFSMALAIFVGINILGILKNGTHFLSLFFPPGAPLALAPLLVFIEFISYTFRVLSLSIRLFANLMSGHTLLKILSTFGWAAVSFWGIFIIPLIIIFLVTGLEIAIAFLQAYIFAVLLCIYINEAFNLH